jgi:histidyl-tRNA synthetase
MGRPKKNQTASSYQPKKIQGLEGFNDIVAETDLLWGLALRRLGKLSRVYGFERVEIPLLEDLRLYEHYYKTAPQEFNRAVQVQLPGKTAVLRSEFLPSVLRAYYQHKI